MQAAKPFGLVLITVFLVAASGLAAQIDMASYYDAPEGNFRELDVTGASNIGTENSVALGAPTVTFATGGGATTFGGPASGAPRPFSVRSAGGGTPQGILLNNARWGIRIGSAAGLTYGTISGVQPGGGETTLYLNAVAGGSVNVGDATYALPPHPGTYALQITGQNQPGKQGRLGVTQGGLAGEIMVAYATGGGNDGYYDTYAP